MIMLNIVKEAVQYFKNEPGFDLLFQEMRKKYQQLGRVGGMASLSSLGEEEKKAIGLFFGKDFSHQSIVKISLANFDIVLNRTKFAGIKFIELLEVYFGEKIQTNQEIKQNWQKKWDELFQTLLDEFSSSNECQIWLTNLLEKNGYGYRLTLKKFEKDSNKLLEDLRLICTALIKLPINFGKRQRLPVFATQITTNPHGLDQKTDLGKLFQTALATIYHVSFPESSEEMAELYLRAGIVKDDISSYVTTNGLVAYYQEEKHPLWQGALNTREVLQVTLRNLLRVDRVQSPHGKVFVVENPAVFSEIIDQLSLDIQIPLVCSNGQFRLATLVLLDMLAKENTIIYYSGDFDPEGLGMAQRLLDRYPDQVKLWRYGVQDYKIALSGEIIEESRIKKLKNITSIELNQIKKELKLIKKAGYQEHLIEKMLEDLYCFFFNIKR